MAKKAKSQQGVVHYISTFQQVSRLSDEKLGKLYRASMEYAMDGRLPDFSMYGAMERESLEIAWGFFKEKIEVDFMRYDKVKKTRLRANKIKFIKNHPTCGLDPTNEEHIARIIKDPTGRFTVSDVPIYAEDESEYDYFPHQLEAVQRQEVERKLVAGGQLLLTEEEITRLVREEVDRKLNKV